MYYIQVMTILTLFFFKYTYLLSCRELDKMIDTTNMSKC